MLRIAKMFSMTVATILAVSTPVYADEESGATKNVSQANAFRLVVRGADTGKDLRHIEVRRMPDRNRISVSPADVGDVAALRDLLRRELEERAEPVDPESGLPVVSGAASPVRIQPREGRAEYYVRSPGYSWGRLETELTAGGEAILVLEPAATLEALLDGEIPEGAVAYLRIYDMSEAAEFLAAIDRVGGLESLRDHVTRIGLFDPDDEAGAAEIDAILEAPLEHREAGVLRKSIPLRSQHATVYPIDSLAAGPVLVSVELGASSRHSVVLASVPVELVVGETKRVSLSFEFGADSVPDPIAVEGFLVIPDEWYGALGSRPTSQPQKIGFRLLDRPRLDRRSWRAIGQVVESSSEEGGPTYAFGLSGLQPGRYEVSLADPAVQWAVEIKEAGPLRLRAPKPAEVVLHVVDPETRKPALDVSIVWHPEGNYSALLGDFEPLEPLPGTHAVRFWTAPGRVVLNGGARGFRVTNRKIDVKPGRNEIDVVGTPEYAFVIRLVGKEDGLVRIAKLTEVVSDLRAVPNRLRVRGSSPSERVLSGIETEKGTRIVVSKPGTYRFDVPAIEGYRPVPTQRVLIEDNQPVVHEIRLDADE